MPPPHKVRRTMSYQRAGGRRGGSRGGGGERHPSHLRGKAIGLFYAKRNKERRENNGGPATSRALGSVLLSDSKQRLIESVLSSTKTVKLKKSDSYEHIQDSLFKQDFLRVLNEGLTEKLDRVTSKIVCNDSLDKDLLVEQSLKQSNGKFIEMQKKRKRLPSFGMKEEILELIESNQIVVISGETGCGKTTQVAQFILDDYIKKEKGSMCRIICTQPRRISAITVAERVADERAERLGNSVGYHIRLEHRLPRTKGSICFCTTGIVLKQMESDPGLSNISHLILDEIHERDVMSDFILALIKQVIVKRKDLKIILMSATLNSEKFSKYYNNAPHLNIPGFTFPVEEYYLEDVLEKTGFRFEDAVQDRRRRQQVDDWETREYMEMIGPHLRLLKSQNKYSKRTLRQMYSPECERMNLELIRDLIIHICEKEDDQGAILVFLTGIMDISTMYKLLSRSGYFPSHKYLIFPLHSLMPTVDQKQIFESPPPGKRKIIISTNIAETSITIDDVVYVVDCGRIKISDFDAENNLETLKAQWVSLANASQRKGRAGRVKPGICYHLYSKAREMVLEQYQKPEILRKRLEGVILNAKILQLGKVESFFPTLIDSPEPEALTSALNLLKQMEALTEDEDLTPLGYHLANLPIAPQLGKMILYGAIFGCLDPILSVASTLDFKDPFQIPLGREKEADERKLRLSDYCKSDHLLYHIVLEKYQKAHDKRKFCYDNFLSQQTLKQLLDMKNQFMNYLHEMKFVANPDPKCPNVNRNSNVVGLVKAIICAGLFPNVGERRGKSKKFLTPANNVAELHMKSILKSGSSHLEQSQRLLVYYIKVKSMSDFIHDGTPIYPLPIIFFGNKFTQTMDNGHHVILINDRYKFQSTEDTAAIIRDLRNRFNWLLEYKITHPGPIDWLNGSEDVKILTIIKDLIASEDGGYYEDDDD